MSVVVSDSFDRVNSTTSLGTADTGQTWTASTGTWGISSNQAYQPGNVNGGIALISGGSITDMTVQATVTVTSNAPGVVARATNATNFYLLDVAGGSLRLFKCVAGGFTQLGSGTSGAANDVLALAVTGTSIVGKKNGTTAYTVTDSALTTGTNGGLRTGNSTDRLDVFSLASTSTPSLPSENRLVRRNSLLRR